MFCLSSWNLHYKLQLLQPFFQTKKPKVGGFNPSEKYARQIGSFHIISPGKVGNNKYLGCHHLVLIGKGFPNIYHKNQRNPCR